MAIAQLMRDMRRPVLQKIVKKNKEWYDELVKSQQESGIDYKVMGPHGPQEVYLYGEDLFIAVSDTIDWVPKLKKLTRYGRVSNYLTPAQISRERSDSVIISWGTTKVEPIEGWPTEEEIAAEIAASAEREKNWNGSLSANDFSAMTRLIG